MFLVASCVAYEIAILLNQRTHTAERVHVGMRKS